jgi:hypothetical protein
LPTPVHQAAQSAFVRTHALKGEGGCGGGGKGGGQM